jgi:hypothetical protein
MQPTYLHQAYLPAPLRRTTQPFDRQPMSHLAIDKWLENNCRDSFRRDVLIPGYLFLSDVPRDQVLCNVIMTVGEVCFHMLTNNISKLIIYQYIDDIYLDNVVLYNLFVAIDIPDQSGIASTFCQSPVAALASFEDRDSGLNMPQWTQMVPKRPLLFRQPRGAVAEMFSALAFWQENNIIVCDFLMSFSFFFLTCPREPCRRR